MVKVGVVYKSDGNVDLTTLRFRVKMSLFIHYMIDSSYILSGNRSKMISLKEEEERRKVQEYTLAFLHHLERGVFKNEPQIPMSFDAEDLEYVKMALGGPAFFEYGKEYVPMEHDLDELKAFKFGMVILRRLKL